MDIKYNEIVKKFDKLKNLKIMIIGDGIIDEYHYCESMGKTGKYPIVAHKYLNHENFIGGAFIIANHLAGLCDNVHLVTLLGKIDSREDFIKTKLNHNIRIKFFYKNDSPTICKKRYINQYLNQKLFEINYLDDNYINSQLEESIIEYLKEEIPKYDAILVSDFGHGFLTKNIIELIIRKSVFYAVNTQINSANAGFNMITKYCHPDFVCIDEMEARLGVQDRFGNIEDVAKKLLDVLNAKSIIITLGKKGSISVNKNGEIYHTPILSDKVVDTIGAGDAVFAFTAPCIKSGAPLQLTSFIGNVVGALAVQIVGNRESVKKNDVLEFIHERIHR